MRSIVVAKAIIQNANGDILLLRRSATDDRRPLEWDLPGGGIEPGEDMISGVVREIYEETNLTVTPEQLHLVYAGTKPWQPTGESVTRLLFATELPENPDIKLSFEHDEFKWVNLNTAFQELTHFFYNTGLRYASDHGLLAAPEAKVRRH